MKLKVIRYKNYGCQMTSEDGEDKFHFSFYELSNGEVIELMLFQSNNEVAPLQQWALPLEQNINSQTHIRCKFFPKWKTAKQLS